MMGDRVASPAGVDAAHAASARAASALSSAVEASTMVGWAAGTVTHAATRAMPAAVRTPRGTGVATGDGIEFDTTLASVLA
jgi:hypothetical protein